MRFALFGLLLCVACFTPAPQINTADPQCHARADSLALALDSARAQLREQRILIRLTEQQANRYAAIVARDPSQARFLKGWMRRAFAGVIPDSVRPSSVPGETR